MSVKIAGLMTMKIDTIPQVGATYADRPYTATKLSNTAEYASSQPYTTYSRSKKKNMRAGTTQF